LGSGGRHHRQPGCLVAGVAPLISVPASPLAGVIEPTMSLGGVS
jgi:hypothetical protein